MMNRNNENLTVTIARQIIAAILAFILMSVFLPVLSAHAGCCGGRSTSASLSIWMGGTARM